LHRKAIVVCFKCRYREKCKDFKQQQGPDPVNGLDKLLAACNNGALNPNILVDLKNELLEIKALC